MSKNEMLRELSGTGEVGSLNYEQKRMAIFVKATEDIENALASLRQAIGSLEVSTNANAKSSDNLARKVYWLNVVIAAAMVLGVIVAAVH